MTGEHSWKLVPPLLFILVAACSSTVTAPPTPAPDPTSSVQVTSPPWPTSDHTPSPAQRAEFSRNRNLWKQTAVSDYGFMLDITCFCGFFGLMPLAIEVTESDSVLIASSDGTPIPPTDQNFEFFSRYATIDRLFQELERSLEAGFEVTMSFDRERGFPESIFVDQSEFILDEEVGLTISGFEAR